MKVPRNSQPNNSKTVRNQHDKVTPKERYISPEERQETMDDVTLI